MARMGNRTASCVCPPAVHHWTAQVAHGHVRPVVASWPKQRTKKQNTNPSLTYILQPRSRSVRPACDPNRNGTHPTPSAPSHSFPHLSQLRVIYINMYSVWTDERYAVRSCIYGGTPPHKKERKKERKIYIWEAHERCWRMKTPRSRYYLHFIWLFYFYFYFFLLGASCQKEITIKVRFVHVISMLVGLFLI